MPPTTRLLDLHNTPRYLLLMGVDAAMTRPLQQVYYETLEELEGVLLAERLEGRTTRHCHAYDRATGEWLNAPPLGRTSGGGATKTYDRKREQR